MLSLWGTRSSRRLLPLFNLTTNEFHPPFPIGLTSDFMNNLSSCCKSPITDALTLRGLSPEDMKGQTNWNLCSNCHKACDPLSCDRCGEENLEEIHSCTPKVQHCGYCSEGYDGKCDGVYKVGALPASADHKLSGESTPEPSKKSNQKGIELMFSKMCELNTPKRGELHRMLIQLFSWLAPMTKHLTAHETKDGWLVTITETMSLKTGNDVYTEAIYLGLQDSELTIVPLPPKIWQVTHDGTASVLLS